MAHHSWTKLKSKLENISITNARNMTNFLQMTISYKRIGEKICTAKDLSRYYSSQLTEKEIKMNII